MILDHLHSTKGRTVIEYYTSFHGFRFQITKEEVELDRDVINQTTQWEYSIVIPVKHNRSGLLHKPFSTSRSGYHNYIPTEIGKYDPYKGLYFKEYKILRSDDLKHRMVVLTWRLDGDDITIDDIMDLCEKTASDMKHRLDCYEENGGKV